MEKLLSQALSVSGIDTIVLVHHDVCPPGTPSPTSRKRKTSTPERRKYYYYYFYQECNEELMAPKRTIDLDLETSLREMNCGTFVQEVVWYNVTFQHDYFLPVVPTDSKKRKGT